MNTPIAKFVPCTILAAGVLLISGLREQHVTPPQQPMRALPTEFAELTGTDTVVSEEEQRIAGMSDYVMRHFKRDSTVSFSVYVGYYDRQIQGKTIHSPKNCLPGAGWEVMSSTQVPLTAASTAGTANRVILANKGAQVLVYYWYQGRGRIESNEYVVKWDLLRDAALYGRTEEALVRVVVPIAGRATSLARVTSAEAEADSVARRVITQLAPAVQKLMPDAPNQH